MTRTWWKRRDLWDCFLAAPVLEEIAGGDPQAAALRQEKAQALVELPVPPEAGLLANLLLTRKLIPLTSATDAHHLALAAIHRADYLLTWNQTHLDNLTLRSRIEDLIRGWGLAPAKVITPERLLMENHA